MPRPQNHLDPQTGPVAAFACTLRDLRDSAVPMPTYREMAKRVHYSVTALSQAAAGRKLPTWEVTQAFVRACGADPAEWLPRWQLAAAVSVTNAAAESDSADQEAQPSPESVQPPGPGETDIDPAAAQTTTQLMDALNRFRLRAGVSLRELSARSHNATEFPTNLSRTTLSNLLSGRGRRPTLDDVLQVLSLCDASPVVLEHWQTCWQRLHGPLPPADPPPSMLESLRTATLTERDLVSEREAMIHPRQIAAPAVPRPAPRRGWRVLIALIISAAAVTAAVSEALAGVITNPFSPDGADLHATIAITGAAANSTGNGVTIAVKYRCAPRSDIVALNATVDAVAGARGKIIPVCDGKERSVKVTAVDKMDRNGFQKTDLATISVTLTDARSRIVDDAATVTTRRLN
ncbi:helix-turn-helix domain-containing protein [Actinomadura soli]|uniref:Helix-turn-helix domain-containing protein n=1 Tax=Actinomadura soli TaxID=2508997 RepID=A0A5C4JD72_9ACTN|nr:helix-turn-helix transcriptional regulator [Actinomadura soli]TMR02201.1 helix-turn-helix domain-containing protein [Actinomadura soli]